MARYTITTSQKAFLLFLLAADILSPQSDNSNRLTQPKLDSGDAATSARFPGKAALGKDFLYLYSAAANAKCLQHNVSG
jgi:hypothetical protein